MKVYQAINLIQADLAKTGIEKNRINQQGSGYNFRGIDDVYNALAPLLATHKLCILPRMVSRTCEERKSKNGGSLFFVTVEAEFDFVSSEDGTKHIVRTFGEAMDSGDKATNKAMSAAYKYAAFQSFAIPTEADNDSENDSSYIESDSMTELFDAMNNAKNQEELKLAYLIAYAACDSDKAWQKKVIDCKDARKKALTEGQE